MTTKHIAIVIAHPIQVIGHIIAVLSLVQTLLLRGHVHRDLLKVTLAIRPQDVFTHVEAIHREVYEGFQFTST